MNNDINEEIQYVYPQQRTKPRFNFNIKPLPIDKPYINLILLIATIISTWLTIDFTYSIAIISILFAHEMGHYIMCRRYGVPATLPFFIPFPFLNPFGTMGAIIQMRGYIPSRKALFDIGAAGPIAGFILSVPAIYFGMKWSTIVPSSEVGPQYLILGEPLLFKIISYFAVGNISNNYEIITHPVGYAGWAGLFVTSLNLLPIGQLDGGHIIYSMFGQKARLISFSFLAMLGIIALFFYPGWALLFILLLILGRKHPAPIDDFTLLDKKRRLLGYIIFIIFLTSFTPVPFKF